MPKIRKRWPDPNTGKVIDQSEELKPAKDSWGAGGISRSGRIFGSTIGHMHSTGDGLKGWSTWADRLAGPSTTLVINPKKAPKRKEVT